MANYPPVHGKVNTVSAKMKEGCRLHFLLTDDRVVEGVVKMRASEVVQPIFWGSDQSIRL